MGTRQGEEQAEAPEMLVEKVLFAIKVGSRTTDPNQPMWNSESEPFSYWGSMNNRTWLYRSCSNVFGQGIDLGWYNHMQPQEISADLGCANVPQKLSGITKLLTWRNQMQCLAHSFRMSDSLEAPKSGMLELSRTMLAWDPKSLIWGLWVFYGCPCDKLKVKSWKNKIYLGHVRREKVRWMAGIFHLWIQSWVHESMTSCGWIVCLQIFVKQYASNLSKYGSITATRRF